MLEITNNSLRDIFNDVVTAHSTEYSEAMEKVIVAMADGILYLSQKTEKFLKGKSLTSQDIVKRSKNFCDGFGERTIPAFFEDTGDITESKKIRLLFLNNNSTKPKDIIEVYKEHYKINHEFGHCFADFNNEQNQHISESIAEAYASLMHIKTFGKNTNFVNEEIYLTSTNALFSSINHYTVPATDAVNLLKDIIDIEQMSLTEIAELANEIAYEYYYDEDELKEIMNKYEKVFDEYVATEDAYKKENFMKEIVNTMLENKEAEEIYRVGWLYFNIAEVQEDLKILKEHDAEFWNNALKEISEIGQQISFEKNSALAKDKKREYSAINEIAEIYQSYKLEQKNKTKNSKTLTV